MENLKEIKNIITKLFYENNIDKAEVNILFSEVLNCSVAELRLIDTITYNQKRKLILAANKRVKGMPIQKIFKRAYFFGLTLFIDNNVLCPRPETELLVEEALKFAKKDSKILDLCTGSGAIALVLCENLRRNFGTDFKVFASDISKKALKIAKINAKKHNLSINFIKSDMFNQINNKFDIIVSNPPYIPSNDCATLDVEVKNYDPIISLDGGEDGLDFYRIIAQNAKDFLKKDGKLMLEVGINEAEEVKKLLEQNKFACYIKKDYNNIDRIVVGEIK